jgi:hypothetical protein
VRNLERRVVDVLAVRTADAVADGSRSILAFGSSAAIATGRMPTAFVAARRKRVRLRIGSIS